MAIQQNPIIGGRNEGKRISCEPRLQPAFDRLKRAALSNNYWATLAIREIESLSSGLAGKSNVYFRPGDYDPVSHATRVTVFLPGLKAILLELASGHYHISELVFDGMYESAQQSKRTGRMGLYDVRSATGSGRAQWAVEYKQDGRVQSAPGRMIAVSDAGYSDATAAANSILPRMMKAPDIAANRIVHEGCELHYTPGPKNLGGLLAYNAFNLDECRASALHLAESMVQARDVPGIAWLADNGGSAVLTQAMQILADKGVTLRGHTAYIYKARTSPGQALLLAHKLEMSLNETFAGGGASLRNAGSMWLVTNQRFRNEYDLYDKQSHTHAWLSGLNKAAVPGSLAGAGAAALGASIPMVGGIIAAITATSAAYSLGQSVVEDVKHRRGR